MFWKPPGCQLNFDRYNLVCFQLLKRGLKNPCQVSFATHREKSPSFKLSQRRVKRGIVRETTNISEYRRDPDPTVFPEKPQGETFPTSAELEDAGDLRYED